MSSGFLLHAVETGRYHLGVIDHQTVSRMQIIHDIIKMPMPDFSGILVHHQKP